MSRFFFLSQTDIGRRVLRQAFNSKTSELNFSEVLSLCQLYDKVDPWEAAAMANPRIFNASFISTLDDRSFRMIPQDSIEGVKLDGCGFEMLLATLSVFAKTSNLTFVSFENNLLLPEGIKNLSEAIPQCRKLKSLSLAECDLRGVSNSTLKALASSTQLEVLTLDGAIITETQLPLLEKERKITAEKRDGMLAVERSVPYILAMEEPLISHRVHEHPDAYASTEAPSMTFSSRR